jgi:hypothetical protein
MGLQLFIHILHVFILLLCLEMLGSNFRTIDVPLLPHIFDLAQVAPGSFFSCGPDLAEALVSYLLSTHYECMKASS